MKILVIGSGGREHAIAWKAAQSSHVQQVWVAPGNAGTALENKVQNIEIKVDDVAALLAFAKQQQIDLTIVGPEVALAAGVVDRFQSAGLACFGPTQMVAQLETSKIFSKQFMVQHQIPTAKYAYFDKQQPAIQYALQQSFPLVIKADGLAAGKGVVIAENADQAIEAISNMMEQKIFGEAGERIVIEEFLQGSEMSFIVMTDGLHILPLASSKDHKRRDDHDLGPNTGGMGAYSPAPQLTDALQQKILDEVIEPVIQAFAKQGTPYVGFLYAGLMITQDGCPKVLEFNCRLGDPETQPILIRLQSDLVDLCCAAIEGQLDKISAQWDEQPALTVILAAEGYPVSPRLGDVIHHLPAVTDSSCKVFHSGTRQQNQQILTAGGRVLAVTCAGKDLPAARDKAYSLIKQIAWDNCHYRQDIGLK